MTELHTLSGAEFKAHFKPLIESLKDNDQVFFGNGNISFYRTKERGPLPSGERLVQVAFNELITVQHEPDEEPANR